MFHPVLVNWIRWEDFMSRRRNRFNGQLELNGSGNAMKILQVAGLDVVKTWGHTKFIKTFQKWCYKVERFINCSVFVPKKTMVYIYETNQNLGGYNGLYRQRYDLGSSQPWGTQIFWPPVTGDLHHLKRSGGCYTFTMKHSTIQDPLPNSQKHPRATTKPAMAIDWGLVYLCPESLTQKYLEAQRFRCVFHFETMAPDFETPSASELQHPQLEQHGVRPLGRR